MDVVRIDGLHEIRCHHDHQFGFAFAIGGRTEQVAKDRNVSEARSLVDRVRGIVGQQARNHEALTRTKFHRRFGTPCYECRDLEAFEDNSALARKLRYFWTYPHRDAPIGEHGGRIGEAYAVVLVLDGGSAETLTKGDRKLATREEFCRFAGKSGQVWLRERGHEPFVFSKIQRGSNVEPKKSSHRTERGARGNSPNPSAFCLYKLGRICRIREQSNRCVPHTESGKPSTIDETTAPLTNAELKASRAVDAGQVDPNRTHEAAADFGNTHLQIDLQRRRHTQAADDIRFRADEGFDKTLRFFGIFRSGDRPGEQDDIRPHGGDRNVGFGHGEGE